MKEFAVFWGCTIPARFPFIEKATRVMFDDLGAQIHELDGHTCCPEGTLVKANDPDAFYTAAARNLALVENAGLDRRHAVQRLLLDVQGGAEPPANELARARQDQRAPCHEDLHYDGDLKVVHFAEWLADHMGAGLIASKAKKPFWGMNIAVHYGCHLLRPQPAVKWDDPLHPKKVEEIVAALGARVVDYPTKMQCCGGYLDRVGEREGSLAFNRRKLHDLQNHEVDALVVVCPSCFQQFDLNQAALQRANEPVHVPVLYLSELIALAYGHAPEEIGMDMHRVSVQPFLDKWEARAADKARLAQDFDVALLGKCDNCQACKDDCPVCKVDPTFQPTDIIGELVAADIDEVLDDANLWKCLECYTCLEMCHSDIGMAETFRTLKELAIERGSRPSDSAELRDVHGDRHARQAQGGRAQEARARTRCRPTAETPSSDSWAATQSSQPAMSKERNRHGVRSASRADAHEQDARGFSDREGVFGLERPAYREEAPFKIHGGCGLMGICDECGTLMSGEDAIRAMAVQRDRGNGLGGGFAGYGIYPEFPDHFCFHMMYHDVKAKEEAEAVFDRYFTVDLAEPMPTRPVQGHRRRAAAVALLPAARPAQARAEPR